MTIRIRLALASPIWLLWETIHAQDFLSSELSSEQTIALIERKDSDSKNNVVVTFFIGLLSGYYYASAWYELRRGDKDSDSEET